MTEDNKQYDSSIDGVDPKESGTTKPEALTKDFDQSIDGVDVDGDGLVTEQKERFTDNADYKTEVGGE
ncbi:hypothetical protein [Macrococcus equipercicus]|uniref:Uncharacterized protein n=1 Tax=Macrococcus equipercicus TaxID=69967 RepID=A0A9Q9F1B2_9STAP|nr:hypothetical protein [Macrococcus equipercicus]KAA1039324.1 hypothetical protein ERX35_007060 [Macrococcus equipercicus]UTH13615.1 hypothetical protein KFV11_10390 [Macrococcus equipercicus]